MHCVYLEDNNTRLHYFCTYVCSQARQAGAYANSASQSPPADQARVGFSFSRGLAEAKLYPAGPLGRLPDEVEKGEGSDPDDDISAGDCLPCAPYGPCR